MLGIASDVNLCESCQQWPGCPEGRLGLSTPTNKQRTSLKERGRFAPAINDPE